MSLKLLPMLLALGIQNTPSRPRSWRRTCTGKPVKKCLNCPKYHRHNNSFCSADCCRAWRAKPAEERQS